MLVSGQRLLCNFQEAASKVEADENGQPRLVAKHEMDWTAVKSVKQDASIWFLHSGGLPRVRCTKLIYTPHCKLLANPFLSCLVAPSTWP